MNPAIDLDDIWARPRGGPPLPALSGLSLQVQPGAYAGVVGPPGSGKSTLLGILALHRRPEAGEYRLHGTPTAALPPHRRSELQRTVELVGSEPELVPHLTAVENVQLGMFLDRSDVAQRDRRAGALLAAVGLKDRGDVVAARLSAAEHRLVALARALGPRPTVLLCDDPVGGLDDHGAEAVLDALDAVRTYQLTMVVATRRRELVRRADTVVTLRPPS
ncbi:MAG: D-methionine transport system ATP-binding protein [Acidimicrobiaceae bacterium]|jgi:ABC-type lipoprotein export system ATPase subunit|nr:D-methionine transport system ATP-binding protein [Acidimicrobiaceae bacterium]